MRWQRLFADLAAQWQAAEVAGDRAELASRTRAEVGAQPLADRFRAAIGSPVALSCRGAGRVEGVLDDVGVDWLLLSEPRGTDSLVALSAVASVSGLGAASVPAEGGTVRRRLDLRWALRVLARDRGVVQMELADGGVLTGTIDRVGADFLDLAEHDLDEPRRAPAVRRVHAVVLDAVMLVRTASREWG